ncbi:MAG TPA: outer membrane beta-barrel protein [Bacteroidales bacterium]|nr:outer membrane beta-barrel protein [Bacteroidales bacterium]
MKKTFTFLLLLLCGLAEGQVSNLKGEIINENAQPLSSAAAVLLNPADSTLLYFSISGNDGQFEIRNIKKGTYLLQVSLLGHETVYRSVEVPNVSGENIGSVVLVSKIFGINEVTVTGERIPLKIKKDTIEYDAGAYKLKPDAVAEDLVRKLPGIEVDRAGNIKALGEDVNNILVDGKEFFGNDPKVATRNLPADAIEKIQLYDKPTDESKFTGIDDGERNQTMNLILQDKKRRGIFGDISAGAGTDERAQAGAKMYRFTGKSQLALVSMYNNINQLGFSMRDYINFSGGMSAFSSGDGHIMIGGENSFPVNFGQPVYGTGSNGAAGFNFSFSKNDNDRFFMSYLGNGSKRSLSEATTQKNYTPSGSFLVKGQQAETKTDTSQRINFGIRNLIGEKQNIIINGGFSLNSATDEISSLSSSLLGNTPVNALERKSGENVSRLSGNIDASYLLRINGSKTILKISGKTNLTGSNSSTRFYNKTEYFSPSSLESGNQFYDISTSGGTYSGNISLTQKITRQSFIDLSFGLNYSDEQLNRNQGDIENGLISDTSLSPEFNKTDISFRPGLKWKLVTSKTSLTVSLLSITGEYNSFLNNDDGLTKKYSFISPGASIEYNYRSGRRLMFNYSALANTPAAMQLLPVVNNLNPLSLIYGNRDLKPEYIHNSRLTWWLFDQFSFTTLLTSINLRYAKDKTGYSRTIGEDLRQVISLVNVKSDIATSGTIDFTTPVRPLGITLNLVIDESLDRGLDYINNVENVNNSLTQRFSLTISNRKKERWDIETGTALTLVNSKYSVQKSLNDSYLDIAWFTEARYNPCKSLSIMSSADITKYSSGSFNESRLIPLVNTEISYNFLKNKRGILTLSGVDLLNRNTGIIRLSELNTLTERRSAILGRYIILSFKYRLNKLGDNTGGIDIKVNRR